MADLFTYNIAYTTAANKGADPEERLTHEEVFQGIRHGGRYPGDFGDFVKSCDVVSGDRFRFVREIVIGDGAVHTADGTKIVQDVVIQDGLSIAATTRDTGATSTLVVSYDSKLESEQEDTEPFLTVFYELKMGDKAPEPGSKEAGDIGNNYRMLAKNMCNDAITRIRKWKVEGKLAKWAEDDRNGIW